jgi:hypothetical protein
LDGAALPLVPGSWSVGDASETAQDSLPPPLKMALTRLIE